MEKESLFAALDDALGCPQARNLSSADRLALALWWVIESVAEEFTMPLELAADQVAMLCRLAKEMVMIDNYGGSQDTAN